MDGIYFTIGNLVICFIVFWSVVNDHAGLTGRTVGLLAMPDDGTAVPASVMAGPPGAGTRGPLAGGA